MQAGVTALLAHHRAASDAAAAAPLIDDGVLVSAVISLRQVPPSRVRPIAM